MSISLHRPATPWLRAYRAVPLPPASRLVCFPHAGAGASFFRSWAYRVPPEVELLSVQYPGREERLREPFCEDMCAAAAEIAAGLQPLGGVPVGLFGHSLGAAMAYEVARCLENAGTAPSLLVVSARAADYDPGDGMHLKSDAEIWAETCASGGTSEELLGNDQFREFLLPVLRADYMLSERYKPAKRLPLSCPILACEGDRDPGAERAQMSGWEAFTASRFELRVFPGDHFYLRDAARELLREITRRLPAGAGTSMWPPP